MPIASPVARVSATRPRRRRRRSAAKPARNARRRAPARWERRQSRCWPYRETTLPLQWEKRPRVLSIEALRRKLDPGFRRDDDGLEKRPRVLSIEAQGRKLDPGLRRDDELWK